MEEPSLFKYSNVLTPWAHWPLRSKIKRRHVLAYGGLWQSWFPELVPPIILPLSGGTVGRGTQSSESKETWLPAPIRSEWVGFCNSWNSESSLIKWEARTKHFLRFFLLLTSVKWVCVFPKCLFHYLLLTRAVRFGYGWGVVEGKICRKREK